jgi:small-conductance mechanosensitive channel
MTLTIWLFISGAALFAIVLIVSLSLKLKKLERQRQEALGRLRETESIPTNIESPHDQRKFIRNAAEAIASRFTVIRRFIIPLIALFAVMLGSIPFLEGVARSYASLVIGVITVILGFAARPFIENFISGLLLLMGQSIRTGDTVLIDGHYGTVEEIRLTYTSIKIWDWRRYIVPNSEFIKKAFINYTYRDQFIWTCVEFFVSPDTNMEHLERLSKEAMKKSSSLADLGEPVFWVIGMEHEQIKCWIVGWADTPHTSWNISHDTRMALLKSFREHRIKAQLSYIELQDPQNLRAQSV